MKDRDDRLEAKIDKVVEKIGNIEVVLSAQSEILKDHTRRSLANEKSVDILKEELKPVFTHLHIMNFIGKCAAIFLTSEILWAMLKWLFIK